MKKSILLFFLLIFGPMAIANSASTNDGKKEKTELTEAQKERLAEMEAMKAEARENGNGIYLSVGALIVILLILILIT